MHDATVHSPPHLPRPHFTGVQAIRFIAALLVVFSHVPSYIRDRGGLTAPSLPTGQLGVAVFFAISGFVAVLTTQHVRPNGARRFAYRRLARIVPLAWLVLTLKVVTGLLAPDVLERFRPDGWYVLASYLFLPARGGDGLVQPLYTVMWTLSFELFFYGIVALALAARRTPLTVVAPTMTALACASAFRTDPWPAFQFHADPYVLLFVIGMVFGHVATRTASARTLAWGIVAVVVWTGAELVNPTHGIVLLPVATLTLGVILLVERWIPPRIVPSVDLLGDASYALYLTHPIAGPATVAVLAALLPSTTPWWLLGLAAAAVAVLVSIGIWFAVDRPLTRLFSDRLHSPSRQVRQFARIEPRSTAQQPPKTEGT